MQCLPTVYAGIIHLVLLIVSLHNLVRIDGLLQLTRARVVIVTVTYHNFNITVFLAYLLCLLLVASTFDYKPTVESNRTNRF